MEARTRLTLGRHFSRFLVVVALAAGMTSSPISASAGSTAIRATVASQTQVARRTRPDLTESIAAVTSDPAPASVAPAPAVIPAVVPPAPSEQPLLLALTNRLVSADGSLDVGLGLYSDCTGHSPIDPDRPDLYTCVRGRAYFVGHSPGAFSPILAMDVGARITWYDGRGAVHRLVVVSRRDILWKSGLPHLANDAVVAQFQTCVTLDGSIDRVLDAVEI